MDKYDLVIIGAGASGLSAGIESLKLGIKNVLILEKEDVLGGNLNLFIHNGFGKYYLGEEVTGPELGSILIRDFKELGGQFKINTRVLEVNRDKEITYVNPCEGIETIEAKSIILASGCREKYTGNIMVPIDKFTGIFTTVAAQKLVNLNGYLPGKNVIITGNDKRTLILARRLLLEGANIRALVTERKAFNREELEVIKSFNIPIAYESSVIEIEGEERINLSKIINRNTGEVTTIECDSLILSVGNFPAMDYLKKISLMMEDDSICHNNNITSVDGIFICGTMANGTNDLYNSGKDGMQVGKLVSEYLI